MLDTQDDVIQDFLVELTTFLDEKHDRYLNQFARKLYQDRSTIRDLEQLEKLSDTCANNTIKNLKINLFFCWAQAWRKQDKLQMIQEVAIHELGETEATKYLKTCYSNGEPESE